MPSGASLCAPCPVNTWCPSPTGDAWPTPCPAGTHSPVGSKVATDCLSSTTAASKCTVGAVTCRDCDNATTCPVRACAAADCSSTSNTAVTTVSCGIGQYIPVGAFTCTPCPANTYCPNTMGNHYPYPCPAATPVSVVGTSDPAMCTAASKCTVGAVTCKDNAGGAYRACVPADCSLGSSTAVTTANCGIGHFIPSGATACTPCPANTYCPNTSGNHYPTPCPAAAPISQAGSTMSTMCIAATTATSTSRCTVGAVTCKDSGPNASYRVCAIADCSSGSSTFVTTASCGAGQYILVGTTAC